MAISNSQYNAIIREYEELQAKARREQEERTQEVYRAIPRMKELCAQAGSSALERYRKLVLEKKKDVLDDFGEEIEEIRREKEALLAEHGFERDYMELRYRCPDCKDSGYKEGRKCSCFRQKINKLLYAQSNIDKILSKENFDSFSYELYDDERKISNIGMTAREYMRKIVAICENFVSNFDQKHENIMFMGNTGVGKTFLSNCIAKRLLDSNHSVIYMTATEFFDRMGKSKFEKDSEIKTEDMLEHLTECELLIIDDLGTEVVNSFTSSGLFYIINRRLNAEKSMIISTNLSMKMLRDIYTERVTSRISSSYYVIPLYGDDIRRKVKV